MTFEEDFERKKRRKRTATIIVIALASVYFLLRLIGVIG
jgi:hypothetical protein